MKVIYGNSLTKVRLNRPCLAIGVFDGVHVGHQHIIRTMRRRARRSGRQAVVMTFYPHPLTVVCPRQSPPLIVSLAHRLQLIAYLGVDVCLVMRFTKSFSRLTAERFIEHVMRRLNPHSIYVGYDFRFGRERRGDISMLKQRLEAAGITVNSMSPVRKGRAVISSSKIRRLIAEGKLGQAGSLLGRPPSIWGRVERGERRGTRLGFPTANLVPTEEILPPFGVYCVSVIWKKSKLWGIANVGSRPSFSRRGARPVVEVHIFDLQDSLYQQWIEVLFYKKIREERVFQNENSLIRQIERDIRKVKRCVKECKLIHLINNA